MNDAGKQAPLRIRGTPLHLSALVPGFRQAGTAPVTAVEVSLPAAGAEVPAKAARRKAASPAPEAFQAFVTGPGELHLNLPRDTPPGVYEGTMRIGDREQQVTVEVEPQVELRLFPTSLRLAGSPGEKIDAELTLINEGNAPARVRSGYSFWLVREEAADNVLGRLFEASGKPDLRDRRLERLLDAVEEQYGGNVRVRLQEGAGEIAPGASRELRVQFALPARLQPGRTYIGMWHLYSLRWQLQLTVNGETQGEDEAEEVSS
jgi:hypothetical protein